jgi:hypothetical protein
MHRCAASLAPKPILVGDVSVAVPRPSALLDHLRERLLEHDQRNVRQVSAAEHHAERLLPHQPVPQRLAALEQGGLGDAPVNVTSRDQRSASGESPNLRQEAAWVISPMTWWEELDELVFVGVGRRSGPGGDM